EGGAVDVTGRQEDAATEARVGQEAPHQGVGGAVEHLDVAARGVSPGDDVGVTVAVDVARGHRHRPSEADVGKETAHLGATQAVEHFHVAARHRPGEDEGVRVAVDVAGRHGDVTDE